MSILKSIRGSDATTRANQSGTFYTNETTLGNASFRSLLPSYAVDLSVHAEKFDDRRMKEPPRPPAQAMPPDTKSVQELQADVARLESKLSLVKANLATKSTTLENLSQEMEDLKASSKASNHKKDRVISELRCRCAELKSRNEDLAFRLREVEARNTTIKRGRRGRDLNAENSSLEGTRRGGYAARKVPSRLIRSGAAKVGPKIGKKKECKPPVVEVDLTSTPKIQQQDESRIQEAKFVRGFDGSEIYENYGEAAVKGTFTESGVLEFDLDLMG